jgi:2-dehydropantoate 2-reductase
MRMTEEPRVMKIAIVGAGAVGSVIGAHLVRAGEEVIFLARGQRAAWIQQHGLRLTGRATFTVPVTVTTQPHAIQEADVLMVLVKAYDMDAALASLRHVQAQSVLGCQNGVLKNEQLARTFGWEHVLGATAGVSAELLPDGTVHYTANSGIFLGECPTGTSARVDALVATLSHAGFRATASPQMQTVEWSKYVTIISTMAPGVLTRLAAYQSLKDPDGALLVARLLRETALLAATLQIPLDDQAPLPVKTLCNLSQRSRSRPSVVLGRRWKCRAGPRKSRPCRTWNAGVAWKSRRFWAMPYGRVWNWGYCFPR